MSLGIATSMPGVWQTIVRIWDFKVTYRQCTSRDKIMPYLQSPYQEWRRITLVQAALLECREIKSYKLICNICKRKFGCPAEVRKHKERRHPLFDRSTACSECGKVLSCASAVRVHQRKVHQENRSKARTICGQKLSSSLSLTSHTNIQQGLRKCLKCYRYIDIAKYQQHSLDCGNQGVGPVSICPECGKTTQILDTARGIMKWCTKIPLSNAGNVAGFSRSLNLPAMRTLASLEAIGSLLEFVLVLGAAKKKLYALARFIVYTTTVRFRCNVFY